jgi:hydrogenase maturation protein HypF
MDALQRSQSVIRRMHMSIRGAVQGVGFRPFIYRLASDLGLHGWVLNSPQGVFVEVEGAQELLHEFLLRTTSEKPPRAFVQSLEYSLLDPAGFTSFEIRASDETGEKTALVLPDVGTCPDCLADFTNPSNRRYLYPFTNCTNCGPRYSIIRSLPYDRANTTMEKFTMCPTCRAEYDDPLDRRFHAQPNACPVCGPQIELWDPSGVVLTARHDALLHAANAIRTGKIVAVKGLGGFHLVVDARNDAAIKTLRQRKHREEKPFALMFPTLGMVRSVCVVSLLEARLLQSSESPIVLLRRLPGPSPLAAESVAPANPYLGIMLPYTPLHHLLIRELGIPIVATSGNISDEPICTDEHEALDRLGGMADAFLVHNRPIHRHVDDSIVRVILDRELIMRRARGYAPLPITIKEPMPDMLAVGPHLKNTVAVSRGTNVFISQHIGDLETEQSFLAFQREIRSLQTLYEIRPAQVVSDLHPEYLSTKYARDTAANVIGIQHHWAHVAACAAENEVEGPFLGVAWDGTGYGTDSTVWGGEFLVPAEGSFRRVAHLRPFMLPGGESAIKEPRRSAIGVLFELFGTGLETETHLAPVSAFGRRELTVVTRMLERHLNSPVTSSAGRLFDAVAGLIGVRQRCTFEGQAAMELEYLADGEAEQSSYTFQLGSNVNRSVGAPMIVDWEPMVHDIIDDLRQGISRSRIASRFHTTLVAAIVKVAQYIAEERVILTGGCFQNRILTELSITKLRAAGFHPTWHQRVPPNDGGVALGQLYAATMIMGQRAQEGGDVSSDSR